MKPSTRSLFRLASITLFTTAFPLAAQGAGFLSYAPNPVRLLRGTAIYAAGQGSALESGDIVESGKSSVQIEGPGATLVALGPETRVYLGERSGAPDLFLLSGWLKLTTERSGPAAVHAVHVDDLRFELAGSAILHAAEDRVEIFCEDGAQIAQKLDRNGNLLQAWRLGREDYGLGLPGQPFRISTRSPQAFIGAMPPMFFDPLKPMPHRGPPTQAKKEREADYADAAPWLSGPSDLRKLMVARFRGRLADPAFRKQLDAALGETPEWKPLLHPPRPRRAYADRHQ